ncbi:glycosyltransferase family 2 protein [Halanaerobium salsuginis]|uniref:Glycosyltransferase involved in cell wall bisynthesis n=1 Tax=Halanaerobium salsuginis TaxID=29563 RepID=A0A1I4GYE7_9FIRM|nr:glycosyltransferase family 2 protein [Halanaerobium salsuginis]SFL34156.1 Glycosyltransferase involved in cell wall bisynthesis [Halanaerobium salsuginis]
MNMNKYKYDISFVVPVYNELQNLKPLTARIITVVAELDYNCQLVYVDDGSQDGSSEQIDQLAKKHPNLKALHFTENNGQTAAFLAGFRSSEAKYIATLDADLQIDPADVKKLIPYLKDYDMVIGIRSKRNDSWVKKISSLIANRARNLITAEEITDTGCPLKIFRSEVQANFYPFQGMHRFYPTLAKMTGYQVKEVEVNHHQRQHGSSKYGINNRLWCGILDTIAVRWMKNRIINYQLEEE